LLYYKNKIELDIYTPAGVFRVSCFYARPKCHVMLSLYLVGEYFTIDTVALYTTNFIAADYCEMQVYRQWRIQRLGLVTCFIRFCFLSSLNPATKRYPFKKSLVLWGHMTPLLLPLWPATASPSSSMLEGVCATCGEDAGACRLVNASRLHMCY
jgi:hypothetical protein